MLNTLLSRARPGRRSLAKPGLAIDPLDLLLPPEAMAQLPRLIPQETTVLLTGETGTGKTRLAQRIHDLSPRRLQPFIHVNCGALTPSLIESELFGHVAGAFTGAIGDREGKFAAAGQGSLLLDEIGALPITLQHKLLRVVDDRSFEPVGADASQVFQARLIVTSSLSLEREVAAGNFRFDLFHRLNVVSFHLPPLRLQRRNIVPLAMRFFARFAADNRPQVKSIHPQALALLERYDWPGNIRELRNIIEHATALVPRAQIRPEDLRMALRGAAFAAAPPCSPSGGFAQHQLPLPDQLTLLESTQQVEIAHITQALRKHHNNRLKAAAELGISRMSLYKKLHKYGLLNLP